MVKILRSLIGFGFILVPVISFGMNSGDLSLRPGLLFQKEYNGFWYNGLSLNLSHQRLWSQRIQFELQYSTSKLGSGINSLALRQDKIELLTGVYFRTSKLWQPNVRLMLGYGYIDTEGFDFYESNFSFIYGFDFGSRFAIHPKWGGPSFQIGFNLKNGLGVVFPLHTKMAWEFPVAFGRAK